jgi:transposase
MGMDISVLGVDLGKNVCSVVGLDASGAVVLRRRAKRQTLIALAAKLPPCVVAMEACCGAHHLGRVFAGHGHDVGADVSRVRPTLCQSAEERRS